MDMEPSPQMERVAKGIRGLTVAVWCLVAVNVIQLAAWLIPVLAPNFYIKHVASRSAGVSRQPFESWEGLSFKDKLKRSSIVLIADYKLEGGKLRAIITEELKHKVGTKFYYGVGDEYLPYSIVPKQNTVYGEGVLVLLQGSPATHRESFSIYNGSVSALGDMPLSKVRKLAAESR